MRHFRIAWPTVLAAVGCTTFLFTCIATNSAISSDIQKTSPEHSFSSEISDMAFYASADEQDFSDGDYYYKQKYGYIYAQTQQRFENDMSADADTDKGESEADKDTSQDDTSQESVDEEVATSDEQQQADETDEADDTSDMDSDGEDGPIDGTIPTEHGEETDSYIYQYEEAGYSDADDSDADDSDADDSDADDSDSNDSESQDMEDEYSEALSNYGDYDESQYPEDMDYETQDDEYQYSNMEDRESPEETDTDSQDTEGMENDGYNYEFRYSEAMDYTDQSNDSDDNNSDDNNSDDNNSDDNGSDDSEQQDIESTETDSQSSETQDAESQDAESQDAESQDAESQDSETMDYYETQDDDSQNTTQSSEGDGYGYTYALPENMYGTSIDAKADIVEVEELMKQPWDGSSQYSDDQYMGSPYTTEYPGEFENNEHLALFTWDPAELLTWSDQETLRVLAMVGDREPGIRRAVLSDYLESLGLDATDLANRFEGKSGLAVLSLADDLAQTAAFLACFRLAERGELESDETLRLLHQSLLHRSDRWNNWIDEVTDSESNIYSTFDASQTDATQTDTAQTSPVLRAVVLTAADSLERIGGVINGLSRQMKNLY